MSHNDKGGEKLPILTCSKCGATATVSEEEYKAKYEKMLKVVPWHCPSCAKKALQ